MNVDIKKIKLLLTSDLAAYDPYDLWKTKLGLLLKRLYYKHGKITIPLLVPFYLLDNYCPQLARIFINPQQYPTVRAFAALAAINLFRLTSDPEYLDVASNSVKWLIENQSEGYHGACWGLNMPWMSITGFSEPNMPFITSTPYCVEALLKFFDATNDPESLTVARSTLQFMEKDLRLLLNSSDKIAVSYGPKEEGRIVVNASSYAMMTYALLGNYSAGTERENAFKKAQRIYNYVISRQNSDGSWYYYDDKGQGNFIDCFHSCFILKNLIKYGRLCKVDVVNPVNSGLKYILENMLDRDFYLVKRFSITAHPSLSRFELYDQAELLNVVLLLRRMDLAKKVYDSIMKYFYVPSNGTFGYQIDVFGRFNKMLYLRWAVLPTIYIISEYYLLLSSDNATV